MRAELTQFIESNLLPGGESIGPEDSLIDRGVVTSIGLMRMVHFLETRVGVRVPDSAMTPDNFETVVAIEALANRLRATAP